MSKLYNKQETIYHTPVISEKDIMAYFQERKNNGKGRACQQIVFQPSGHKGGCLIDSGNLVEVSWNMGFSKH